MRREEVLANSPLYLEQTQCELFYDQGYLAFPCLIDEQTLVLLRAGLAKVIDLSREVSVSGNRFDLENGHSAANPCLRRATYIDDIDPVFWSLCSDSVIPDIAADLLGTEYSFS